MKKPYPNLPFEVVCFFEHGEVETHTVVRIRHTDGTFFFNKEVENTKPIYAQASWVSDFMCCLPEDKQKFIEGTIV
jgi:hypothetical protein